MTIEDVFFDQDQRTIAMANALALPELFEEIAQAAEATIPDAAEAMKDDYEGLIQLHFTVLRAAAVLKKASDAIQERALPIMPDRSEVEGVNTADGQHSLEVVKHKGGSSTQWQHNALWPTLTNQIVNRHPEVFYNPDTGERREPADEAQLFVDQVRTCVTPNWKKGDRVRNTKGLRTLGINPGDYSTYKEGKESIQYIDPLSEDA
jgi:hypothetical protein